MTGKHVQPVPEGQVQPKRSGLAIGLTILTILLCVAVLFLSARRHRDQAVRSVIEERLIELAGYRSLGEPIRYDESNVVPLGDARTVGPVVVRPPEDAWQLRESVMPIGDTRLRIGALSNVRLQADYLHPLDQPWSLGMAEAIRANPFLEPPHRLDDRALLEYLFESSADAVREHVARPRQPVNIAQSALEALRLRSELRQFGRGRWQQPQRFIMPRQTGFVELATAEHPVVSAFIMRNGNVIVEALISGTDGRVDEESLSYLNENWWHMVIGIEGPAPPDEEHQGG